jgi:L-ascorbate metabolism protein UlaG (beta-lactamase superfamily)
MTTRIRYLGIAAYEIEAPVGRVLIDPFLSGSPVAPVSHEELETPDVILVTHAALDHFGDAAEIALRTGAPVVCSSDSVALLRDRGVPPSQIRNTIWGIQVEVGGVHVKPVECHHWAQTRLADGSVAVGWPLAFVVPTEPGISVYHYGDSAISMNMQLIGRLHTPTVGLLGCTQPKPLLPSFNAGAGSVLTGEMSPDEAALAAELLGVRYAVATHYVDVDDIDVTDFLAAVPRHDSTGRRVGLALTAGETLVIDGDSHSIEPAPMAATA